MLFCADCRLKGVCKKKVIQIVTQSEMKSRWLRDFRQFTSKLGLSPDEWRNQIVDWNRDYSGWIKAANSDEEVFLDLEVLFEKPSTSWFKKWINKTCPNTVKPRLRKESVQRTIVVATSIRIRFGSVDKYWGKIAANDNEK